jgi:hypothetical protein
VELILTWLIILGLVELKARTLWTPSGVDIFHHGLIIFVREGKRRMAGEGTGGEGRKGRKEREKEEGKRGKGRKGKKEKKNGEGKRGKRREGNH